MKEGSVRIKICGLSRPEDIEYVNEAKPDFCGFVIHVPKSIRNTAPDQVRALCSALSLDICPVGVFVNEPVQAVAEMLSEGTIKAAQLHGSEDESYMKELRSYGNFKIIKAFRVPARAADAGTREKQMMQWVKAVEDCSADLVLLDEGGGTGRTFDWSMAKRISRPYLLAGGIGADNVTDALETLHPWGIDMSSSVETDGVKDREKILTVTAKVRDWERTQAQRSDAVL